MQLDLDWTKDFIKFEGVQVAGIIAYSITQAWPVFAGFGVADEEDHAHGFFRVGTEYTFFIDSRYRNVNRPFPIYIGKGIWRNLLWMGSDVDAILVSIEESETALVNFKSTQFDFPIFEYRPFRTFSLHQSSSNV